VGRRVALVFVGGVAGSLARHLMVTSGAGIPWGMVAANLIGGAAAGFAVGRIARHSHRALWLVPLAVIGAAGGLTTFSGLAVDTITLLDGGQVLAAAGLTVLSVFVGPAAAYCALLAGRRT